jgi:hypothetical protein
MKWFANKGASLDDRATTTFNLQRTVFEDDMTLKGYLLVFDCDRTWAPETARSKYRGTCKRGIGINNHSQVAKSIA